MNARWLATGVILLLALGAVYGNPLGIGYPTAVLMLFFASLAWFQWDAISEGFRSAKDESNPPIIRLSAKIISGMELLRHGAPRRCSPSASGG